MTTSIDNPVLNSPYEQPDRHYVIGPQGPTGEIRDGRRISESFIPIAVTKEGQEGAGRVGVETDLPLGPCVMVSVSLSTSPARREIRNRSSA